MTEHMSPIPSRIYNAAVGGHVCGPEDVDFGQKVVHLIKYDRAGNEVSFESQVTQANKVYVIHDDFTLSSNVTIPANCVLEFDGGSISGAHTLTGNNTGIQASLVKIFNTDVTLAGVWNVAEAYPEWFGAVGYSTITSSNLSSTTSIQAAIDFASNTNVWSVGLGEYYYKIDAPLKVYRNKDITIYGNKVNSIIYTDSEISSMITTDADSYIHVKFRDFTLLGSNNTSGSNINDYTTKATYGLYFPNGFIYSDIIGLNIQHCKIGLQTGSIWTVNIKECDVMMCDIGIYLNGLANGVNIQNNSIRVCKNHGIVASGASVNITNNIFDNLGNAIAILGGRAVGAATIISENYFESTMLTPIKVKLGGSSQIERNIYTPIFNTGSPYNILTDEIRIVAAYFYDITIEKNHIAGDTPTITSDSDFACVAFLSSTKNASIKDNYIGHNIPILGTSSYGGRIANINISHNNAPGKLYDLCYWTNYSEETYHRVFENIYSEDNNTYPSGYINEGINIFTGESNITETGETYQGEKVYKNISGGTYIYLKNKLGADIITKYLGGILEAELYIDRKDDQGFVKETFDAYIESDNITLRLSGNHEITMPKIRFSGSNPIRKPFVRNGGSTADRPMLLPKDVGFRYFDITINKPIYWNGTAWVDATGTTV